MLFQKVPGPGPAAYPSVAQTRAVRFLVALLIAGVIAAAPLAATAARAGGLAAIDYRPANRSMIERVVLPAHESLKAEAARFAEAAKTVCGGKGVSGANGGAELEARYQALADAYMAVQHFGAGPMRNLMRGSRLYFWPDPRGRVEQAVDARLADPAGPVPEGGIDQRASVALQGLPALEYLLFGKEGTGPAGAGAEPRCALVGAIAANVEELTAGLYEEWSGDGGYAATLLAPSADDGAATALELFKSLHGGLQTITDLKLKPVLGESAAEAKPALAEGRLSGRSARNVALNLAALEALYLGGGEGGFSALVAGRDPELDALLRKAFAITRKSAEDLGAPLEVAATDPRRREKAGTLLTQVRALKQIIRTRLSAALDLSVGFNALDGD